MVEGKHEGRRQSIDRDPTTNALTALTALTVTPGEPPAHPQGLTPALYSSRVMGGAEVAIMGRRKVKRIIDDCTDDPDWRTVSRSVAATPSCRIEIKVKKFHKKAGRR